MIERLILTNFKIHSRTEVYFTQSLSMVTGVNNSGKTSLLEAILIFQECYEKCLRLIQRPTATYVKSGKLAVGQYDFKSVFVSHFESVRSENYMELFHGESSKFSIELHFKFKTVSLKLSFDVQKARNQTAYQIIPNVEDDDLLKINELKPELFFWATKSSPVASLIRNEAYLSPRALDLCISRNEMHTSLRNRLLRLSQQHQLQDVEQNLRYIMDFDHFELKVQFNPNEDMFILADFRTSSQGSYQDIAMLGSGTLQMLEVLVAINLQRSHQVRVVLLDEPDSYLHRQLQNNLLTRLRKISKNGVQMIGVTHNEQMIASSYLSELLHFGVPKRGMVCKPLDSNLPAGRQVGILGSMSKSKIYTSLGISTSAMNVLEAVEADRVVLVEGRSDATYLSLLQSKREELFPTSSSARIAYWSINGISDLYNKLKYWKDILNHIQNEKTLWEKSILVIDHDFLAKSEMKELKKELKSKFGIMSYSWPSYTIESILLSDLNNFALIVAEKLNVSHAEILDYTRQYMHQNKILESKWKSIEGQRKTRQNDFSQFGNSLLKTLSEGNVYSNYVAELKNSAESVHLYCDKNDVTSLLDAIYGKFSGIDDQSLTPEEKWMDLVGSLTANTWDANWTDILSAIFDV